MSSSRVLRTELRKWVVAFFLSSGLVVMQVAYQPVGVTETEVLASLDAIDRPVVAFSRHELLGVGDATTTISSEDDHWFDADAWRSNPATKKCFYVEDVCTVSQRFFYRQAINSPWQPHPLSMKLKWKITPEHAPTITIPPGYPSNLYVESSDTNLGDCTYSMIPNHMVLFSFSDHMLGEFYSRVLMGLFDVVRAIDNKGNATNTTISPMEQKFRSQTQLYLQMDMGKSKLLESQKLYLSAFSSNPALHFKSLFDNPTCSCMKRLIFCGYELKTSPMEGINSNETILQPGRSFRSNQNQGKKNISKDNEVVRRYILERLVDNNPSIQAQIRDQRIGSIRTTIQKTAMLLSNMTAFHHLTTDDPSDWKIVGLAQRESRRQWLKLDEAVHACNKHFLPHKLICVEVNIEKEEFATPVQHILAHASLDALVGIHGAQLTEALLMPPDAVVVELLPWIYPTIKWGSWAQWAHRPTPLGALFSDTSLNHVGYPLSRRSAPNCCQNRSFTHKCFEKPQNQWDNRDFYVDERILLDALQKFVQDEPSSCRSWRNNAGDDYVLYNVNCIPRGKEKNDGPQHFYRDDKWVKEKTAWSLQEEMGGRRPKKINKK